MKPTARDDNPLEKLSEPELPIRRKHSSYMETGSGDATCVTEIDYLQYRICPIMPGYAAPNEKLDISINICYDGLVTNLINL